MEKLFHTRDACVKTLIAIAKGRKEIVVLEADLAKSSKMVWFKETYPERFFQMGIAEQNEFAVAAGMALSGLLPVVSTYSVFASMKACEQVRTYIAYPNLHVIIAVSHGGVTPGNDGATHQAIEDLGIMRSIPNMIIVVPADAVATEKLLKSAINKKGPIYLRLTRDPLPIIYNENIVFKIGKAIKCKDGNDATIIATGDMVYWGLKAAKELEDDGLNIRVLDMHTIKPIDKNSIIKAAKETKAILTIEDHNIYGGLGSAVAEVLSQEYPIPLKIMGIPDVFTESGSYLSLLDKYGLGKERIKEKIKELIKKK